MENTRILVLVISRVTLPPKKIWLDSSEGEARDTTLKMADSNVRQKLVSNEQKQRRHRRSVRRFLDRSDPRNKQVVLTFRVKFSFKFKSFLESPQYHVHENRKKQIASPVSDLFPFEGQG